LHFSFIYLFSEFSVLEEIFCHVCQIRPLDSGNGAKTRHD
jgi:hypothetical protein